MIRKPISNYYKISLGVASVTIFIFLYLFLSHRQHIINPNDKTIPSLAQLKDGLIAISTPQKTFSNKNGDIWLLVDLKATLFRHISGLSVSVIISLILGILMGCYKTINAFLFPIVSFLARVPPTAMIAIFFVLVGTNTSMYIAMLAFGVIPILVQATCSFVEKDVSENLINKAYTLGASECEVILNLILPSILPRFIDAVRLQVGPAMVYLIAAEALTANVGFGYTIKIQGWSQRMNIVYIYLVLLGVIGYAMDWSLVLLRKKLCNWFEKYE